MGSPLEMPQNKQEKTIEKNVLSELLETLELTPGAKSKAKAIVQTIEVMAARFNNTPQDEKSSVRAEIAQLAPKFYEDLVVLLTQEFGDPTKAKETALKLVPDDKWFWGPR